MIEPPPNPRINMATHRTATGVSGLATAKGTVPISASNAPVPEIARAPNRSLSRPMIGSAKNTPSPIGASSRPVSPGDKPRTFRKYSGINN